MHIQERYLPHLTMSLLALALLICPNPVQSASARPRLLVLPWLVVDRTTNQECTRREPTLALGAEAQSLTATAQAGLDAEMHRTGAMEMIPRREWEPHWSPLAPNQVFRQGPGCAVCTPVGELLQYDRTSLQPLAQSVRADYVWLGVTVVRLTTPIGNGRADECCRDALGMERAAVLARSSVLLVRASDGEVVWQRDARRLERDVPRMAHRTGTSLTRGHQATPIPSDERRRSAVRDTVRALSSAFRREQREALR